MKTLHPLTCILFLSLTILTSCHPGIEIDFVNNSGQDLVVVTTNAKSKETRYPAKKQHVVRTAVPLKLRVEHRNGAWNYDAPATPGRFLRHVNAMVSVITLQIEKDGTIYVLEPGTRLPVVHFPQQPSGYPVAPKTG